MHRCILRRELDGFERGVLHDRERFVRFTVNELSSELERKRVIGDVQREDASAGALTRLDDTHSLSGSCNFACGG